MERDALQLSDGLCIGFGILRSLAKESIALCFAEGAVQRQLLTMQPWRGHDHSERGE
jgi:hypothetical protein